MHEGGVENQGILSYPVSTMPERFRWLGDINPISPIIETFRAGVLGAGDASWPRLAYSAGFMLVVLFFGAVIFTKDGFFFGSGNPQALADKIKLFFGPETDQSSMRVNARQRFISNFDQKKVLRDQTNWVIV